MPPSPVSSASEGLTALGFVSAVTWGLGYFGQPHIIVRFMAIDTVEKVATARNIGLAWMGVALVGAQLSELDWRAGGGAWSTALAVVATLLVVWWVGKAAGRALRREVEGGGGAE